MHFFQSTAVVFKISGQLWEVFWVVSVNKVGIIIVCSFVSLLLLLKFEYISKNSKSNCIKNTVVPNWITLIKSNSKKLDFFGGLCYAAIAYWNFQNSRHFCFDHVKKWRIFALLCIFMLCIQFITFAQWDKY